MKKTNRQKFQKSDRVKVIARPASFIGKLGRISNVYNYFDYWGNTRKLYNVRIGSRTLSLFSFELRKA